MGIFISVRVGNKLQENVKLVKEGGKSGVTSVICHNLDEERWISVKIVQKKTSSGIHLLKETDDLYLLGEPGSTCRCDPFSGVDSSVDPDPWALCITSAKLCMRKKT